MKEADIIISGQELTEGQSLTVRVALQSFGLMLQDNTEFRDQLGRNYLARIREINELIAKTAR